MGAEALGGSWALDQPFGVGLARAPLTAAGMSSYSGVMSIARLDLNGFPLPIGTSFTTSFTEQTSVLLFPSALVASTYSAILPAAGCDRVTISGLQADDTLSLNATAQAAATAAGITLVELAAGTGTDRIELYTENYASEFPYHPGKAVDVYVHASKAAARVGLGLNAGHDLNLDNLRYFRTEVSGLLEVSIGHALISDALYFGLENTVQMYLRCLKS